VPADKQQSPRCLSECSLIRLASVAAASALIVLFAAPKSWAQEEIRQEVPTPSSVDQSTTPIERSFWASA
jgi:hypothetical protein